MKRLPVSVLLFALPFCAMAQRGSHRSGAGQMHIPGAITDTGFASALGRSIQGQPVRGNGLGLPITPFLWAAPIYSPPPVYYIETPPPVINQTFLPPPPPQEEPPESPAQQEAPTPVFSGYRAPLEGGGSSSPPASEAAPARTASPTVLKPTLYLIAVKGGAVQTAVAYWYEDDQLHYVGRDHEMHTIPLTQVDRDLSTQLNSERGIDFHFPD